MLHEVMKARIPRGGTISLHFMEDNSDRAANLRALIEKTYPNHPPHIVWEVEHARFTDIAQVPAVKRGLLAPAFVMVDPFGVSQTPMEVLGLLLKSRSCELFVTLMLNDVARHCELDSWAGRLDSLFGTPTWREALGLTMNDLRRFALLEIYTAQLRANGAKYVLTFELWQEGLYKYTIVFATTHPLGSKAMKEAIWAALGTDIYIAPRRKPGQLDLDIATGGLQRRPARELTLYLVTEFKGKSVSVEDLETWMTSDLHPFAPSHLRTALKLLEDAEILIVHVPDGVKRVANTFPRGKGLTIEFLSRGQLSRIR